MRILLPVAALSLALSLACSARAQNTALPDIGSSAGEVIDPGLEARYGAYTLYELRRMGLVLDDPLIDGWLQSMGYRLAAASDTPRQSFTFFMMRDRQINAFATLGGYIGMNAGLVLTADKAVLRDEAVDYARRLAESGVPTEVDLVMGGVHGFDGLLPESRIARAAITRQVGAIARALRS